ncbi:Rha family transcriptional regulator [Desulfovibrio gilichinskyi]|uniref:Phage regulatory protein, rha family n=1 Tax=Desulfovibrio gilichinskyi TaxID=1519643 RepID=A0A1X7CHK4_9BACT|nr:Rha family transcriptional regulator [Desulfovibrio gilichinskyi]SME96578.1 phage regulatory protein, rha family [Desulfovibrio gilichinskyi]
MAEQNLANSITSDNSSVVGSPTLIITNGKPVVSSLTIADHFGKQHKNVLQSIDKLEVPVKFNELNFQPVEYLDAKGEARPAYNITRDGFTLLVMGFTGKKAMQWKIRYIEAFNAMEQELLRVRNRPIENETIQAISDCLIRDNSVHAFIEEACEVASWGRVSKTELYESYQIYCKRTQCRAVHRARFFTDLYAMIRSVKETRPRVNGERPRMLWGIAPYNPLPAGSEPLELPAPANPDYSQNSPESCIATAKELLLKNLSSLPRPERQAMLLAYDALIEAEQGLCGEVRHA